MYIFLTIIIAIFIVWNLLSFWIASKENFGYSKNDILLVKISIIYWYMIFIEFILGMLFFISSIIAGSIICTYTNNDYKICIKENN